MKKNLKFYSSVTAFATLFIFVLLIFVLPKFFPIMPAFSRSSLFVFPAAPSIKTHVYDVAPSVEIFWKFQHCKELVLKAYNAIPVDHRNGLKSVTLFWSTTLGRGFGGGNTIYLRCNNVTDAELVGVFIHEMGHIVDTGVVVGHAASGKSHFHDHRTTLFQNDASLDFYTISWDAVEKKRGTALDFVTGYAQTDPFEDFAESYLFYILHGRQFLEIAKYNQVLKRKYLFLKDRIFGGKEFVYDFSKPKIKDRSFDSTLLPFSLVKFLEKR